MKRTVINEAKCIFLSVPQNEALARSVLSGFILPLDPDAEELADLRCAVSEAVTNCIVHAYKNKASGTVTMSLKAFSDRSVRISVVDNGCGIPDVELARKPLYTTLPGEDRCGMGFSIMESFSDRLSVKSKIGKGTRVIMTRKLSGASGT